MAFQNHAVRSALVFVLYLAAGKLGLSVPFTSGNVSPVWPASGVGLASGLLWGYEVWPAIALAAFFVNFLSSIPTLGAVITERSEAGEASETKDKLLMALRDARALLQ